MLGCKECRVDLQPRRSLHPNTRVGKGGPQTRGGSVAPIAGLAHADGKLAPRCHCINGICDDVGKYLSQISLHAKDGRSILVLALYHDVFEQQVSLVQREKRIQDCTYLKQRWNCRLAVELQGLLGDLYYMGQFLESQGDKLFCIIEIFSG